MRAIRQERPAYRSSVPESRVPGVQPRESGIAPSRPAVSATKPGKSCLNPRRRERGAYAAVPEPKARNAETILETDGRIPNGDQPRNIHPRRDVRDPRCVRELHVTAQSDHARGEDHHGTR